MVTNFRPSADNLRFMLRALQYRNYRLFFGGQVISLIGSWLSTVATSWLVYRLAKVSLPGKAALVLGIVGFASQAPVFLFSPLAGVWIDRWNRHRILLTTQTLSMLQSFALAFLALTGVITIAQVVVLNVLQGIVNAWDIPARQAFVVEIVDRREDLSNAIALSSSMVHGARLIGPALAGVLIYYVGEGWCFVIDGFSYLAVLAALLAMQLTPHAYVPSGKRAWHSLREGVTYAFGFSPIRVLLVMVAVTSLMAMSQSVLMPIFADEILGGSERTLGLLLGSAGLGAFAGTMYLASRRTVLGLGKVIVIACTALGTGLIAFSASRLLWLSMPLLMVTGGALVVQMASCNTLLQTIVDDDKRGRVMSLFTTAFLGVAPFGSLLGGAVADRLGAPWTVGLAGCGCLVVATVFGLRLDALRPLVRPIFVKKGIIAEVATGLEATATPPLTPAE